MSGSIALLRGINVGGNNKVPMARLCALCDELGWRDVRHYIQSGNIVFTAAGKTAAHEAALEQAIRAEFGFDIPVIVRSGARWDDYIHANPFPEASTTEPNRVMLGLSKRPPERNAAESLRERAMHGERIETVGDALWIHFQAGQGKSKLAPALVDRLVGSCVTMRNWNTVMKLATLVRA